jgi:glutamate dehydrogenase/leucine dehydrogenase
MAAGAGAAAGVATGIGAVTGAGAGAGAYKASKELKRQGQPVNARNVVKKMVQETRGFVKHVLADDDETDLGKVREIINNLDVIKDKKLIETLLHILTAAAAPPSPPLTAAAARPSPKSK